MITQENGYVIRPCIKKDVTTDEGSEPINGSTVYLHNAGANIIYIDKVTGVDNTKWELAAGEKTGPFTFKDSIFFKGVGVSTLKILAVEVK